MILLNPGPVTLTARVRAALAQEDLCHREQEFADVVVDLITRLEQVYPDGATHAAVLIGGSGTAAVEAMLSTFAERHRQTLVVANGVYGERMASMLESQGKPAIVAGHAWTDAVDLDRIARLLQENPSVACVAAVHHETTTGRLNGMDELAALCRERGTGLLIDAVSSFGGEEVAFSRWSPLAVAATAGKCLHGAPGLSFVLADRERLSEQRGNSTSLYLDLVRYRAEQMEGWSPYTLPVHVCLALQEALWELEDEGGWQARRTRYLTISARVRTTLEALGVAPLLPAEESSAILSAFHIPTHDSYERIHDAMKAAGFVIYAGQGGLRTEIFRIANMGAIADADLERLVAAFRSVFSARPR